MGGCSILVSAAGVGGGGSRGGAVGGSGCRAKAELISSMPSCRTSISKTRTFAPIPEGLPPRCLYLGEGSGPEKLHPDPGLRPVSKTCHGISKVLGMLSWETGCRMESGQELVTYAVQAHV